MSRVLLERDGERHLVDQALIQSPEYEGWTVLPQAEADDLELEIAKAAAWGRVKTLRAKHEVIASTSFGRVQSDMQSKVNINGLAMMASMAQAAGVAFSEPFTMADNTVRIFNAEEMISMAKQVGAHVASAYSRARALREKIEPASSRAQIEALAIEDGWP